MNTTDFHMVFSSLSIPNLEINALKKDKNFFLFLVHNYIARSLAITPMYWGRKASGYSLYPGLASTHLLMNFIG